MFNWLGLETCMGQGKDLYRVLVRNPQGKAVLKRPRRKFEDSITIDLQEFVCGNMDWNDLAQDSDRWWTLFSAIINFQVP